MHTFRYDSPLGAITLAGDGATLTGLWFDGQKHYGAGLGPDVSAGEKAGAFGTACAWLDRYFAGDRPDGAPLLQPAGTLFQRAVWEELRGIPYGKTATYGELAERIAARRGMATSARAVGSAVGRNPISLMIPCHRVLGASGALTGYAGGLWRKRALIALEQQGLCVREVSAAERTDELIGCLTAVWEESVRATHDFLTPAEIERLRGLVPRAVRGVGRLWVLRHRGAPVGFMGVEGAFLEMLFLAPAVRGCGAGRLMLERAVELLGVRELSVNEQNPQAVGFYEHLGFTVYRRTETDGEGAPYPLLYLRR